MIGEYLSRLTRYEEDRVLTRKMEPWCFAHGPDDTDAACLIGAVHGLTTRHTHLRDSFISPAMSLAIHDAEQWVGIRYNWLCERFGVERVNAAIRGRILRNRLRRALTDPQQKSQLVG